MQNFKIDWKDVGFKSLKYLAELFVVVFGVYIGFKANNYAEELKQKDYVNATIKEMYYSLEEDIKDAELNRKGHISGINAVNYFINIVQNKTIDTDSFTYNLNMLTRNFVSIQNTSPFETIRSKGFNVIENDSLRRQMVKLYDFQFETLEKIEETYQESQLYANESHHINEILDNSLNFDDNLKIKSIDLPLKVSKEDKNRLILILKRIYNTRMFNSMVYDEIIGDMKKLRVNISEVYPFVLVK
jgi:hypothetical protein